MAQKYAFKQGELNDGIIVPDGYSGDESTLVIPYGDHSGIINMMNITFKSLRTWIWNIFTNQNSGQVTGDFVVSDKDDFASLTNKTLKLSNLGGKSNYLKICRTFTTGGGSLETPTLITISISNVVYDAIVLKATGHFRLPLLADDSTLIDGQQVTIMRDGFSGDAALVGIGWYNPPNKSTLHVIDAIMTFIYDGGVGGADRWRLQSNYNCLIT
jgi:hypothetical protein